MEVTLAGVAREISDIIQGLRVKTFALSAAGEAEAIGQALNKKTRYELRPHILDKIKKSKSPSGYDFDRKIFMDLMKIKDKFKQKLYWTMLNSDQITDHEAAKYLFSVLPKTKDLNTRRRIIKPLYMTEADQDPKEDFSSGYLDDETWDEILNDYKTNIKVDRGPKDIAGIYQDPEETPYYTWELEQEVTQDFVTQVRSGQIEAANQNGITEFVWLAVVDDRTDDCCLWRDGLTTKEIEERLKTDHKNDECQVWTPPAHFNCRCQLAPATDDLPEVPASNEKDFEEWLNS